MKNQNMINQIKPIKRSSYAIRNKIKDRCPQKTAQNQNSGDPLLRGLHVFPFCCPSSYYAF